MHRFALLFVVSALFAPPAAWAAPSRAGTWKETGSLTDANGKTVPCNPFCGMEAPPGAPDVSTLCVPADALADFAEQQLTQAAQLVARTEKNCMDGDQGSVPNGHMRAFVCDDMLLTLSVFQPDDRHLSYVMVGERVNRMHPAPHPWPRSRRETNFAWLEAGCAKANGAMRQLR